MFKSILLAATLALPILPFSAPALAETTTSPKETVNKSIKTDMLFGAMMANGSYSVPTMSLSVRAINNNITCRSRARAKYFELGATNMGSDSDNSQWATINSMKALTWCRGDAVIIAVATTGPYSSAEELRDILANAQ